METNVHKDSTSALHHTSESESRLNLLQADPDISISSDFFECLDFDPAERSLLRTLPDLMLQNNRTRVMSPCKLRVLFRSEPKRHVWQPATFLRSTNVERLQGSLGYFFFVIWKHFQQRQKFWTWQTETHCSM